MTTPSSIYGQLGVWWAETTAYRENSEYQIAGEQALQTSGKWEESLRGSGIVVGFGGRFDLSPRLFLDANQQWLLMLPAFHHDIKSTRSFSIKLGVRLFGKATMAF